MDQRFENWKDAACDVARDAACTVGLGARRLTEAAKRQLEIADLHRERDRCLRELGELLYATHTGTPTDSDLLLKKMEEIDSIRERLRVLEGDPVLHLLCPRCGREVRPDDVYCGDCGEKL